MKPAVGKSGPWTKCMRSSTVRLGSRPGHGGVHHFAEVVGGCWCSCPRRCRRNVDEQVGHAVGSTSGSCSSRRSWAEIDVSLSSRRGLLRRCFERIRCSAWRRRCRRPPSEVALAVDQRIAQGEGWPCARWCRRWRSRRGVVLAMTSPTRARFSYRGSCGSFLTSCMEKSSAMDGFQSSRTSGRRGR